MDFISAEPEEFPRQGLHSAQLKFIMRVSLMYAVLSLVAAGVFASNTSFGQEPEDRMTTIGMENEPLAALFTKLRVQTGLSFAFPRKVIEYKNINLPKASRTVKEVLNIVLKGTGLAYRFKGNKVFIYEDAKEETDEVEAVSASGNSLPIPVTGRVTDAGASPLVGVNIVVKGTSRGTTTDANGEFVIETSESEILIFSFIGFKTKEIVIAHQTEEMNILLEPDATNLQEVTINAGYYDVKDREKTGSISKVTAKVLSKQPVTNPLGALQGRMPGVYIQQTSGTPGGDFKIQIRGRNSLRNDGNNPLYIVDGVPFSSEKTFSSGVQGSFGRQEEENSSTVSPLTSINPSDIESIEILKDADATAIYGSRGANGVVLITTKKGKSGKTKFDLNLYSGVAVARTIDLLNTRQFLSLRREAFSNDGIIPSIVPGDPGYSPELMIWDTTRYTNWQDVFLDPAQTMSAQSSISGGNDQIQFLFSLGYRKESSVYSKVLGDFGYQKSSFNFAIAYQSRSKSFNINTQINGSKDGNRQPQYSLFNTARQLAPNAPALYDEQGNLNWENSTWSNPLAAAKQKYRNNVIYLTGSTVIGYQIISGLKFETSLGVNYLHSNEIIKIPHTRIDPAEGPTSADSQVSAGNGTNQSWIIEPQLHLDRKISKGNLSLLIGSTFQEQSLERKADEYIGFPSDALMDNLSSATAVSNYEFVQSLYRYMALFARVNYNWEGKYILNLTARRDGSSRFGPRKQFANFGAIGGAWIFSNESFIRNNSSFISFGKLRASYGITGSDQIGNYQYLDTYSTNTTSNVNNQYQGVTWIGPTRLFNADYAWEVNRKFETALDLSFLDEHFLISLGYYRNKSSNQLINYSLPQITGFNGILANMPATVQNTGIELELTSVKRWLNDFQWNFAVNLTVPRNRLLSFSDIESSTYANTYVVGKPLSIQKVYESTGVDPETGLWRFKDINADGLISTPSDNTKLIFSGQDFYGGVNNSFTYKGWSLDIFFQFVKQTGVTVWGNGSTKLGNSQNIPEFLFDKDIWRSNGDEAEIQRIATGNNTDASNARSLYLKSDAIYGDASFIRLKNLSLSYQFPKKWTHDILCQVYFQGQNILLITEYAGDDPENQSFDFLAPLKMFTVGLQLTL